MACNFVGVTGSKCNKPIWAWREYNPQVCFKHFSTKAWQKQFPDYPPEFFEDIISRYKIETAAAPPPPPKEEPKEEPPKVVPIEITYPEPEETPLVDVAEVVVADSVDDIKAAMNRLMTNKPEEVVPERKHKKGEGKIRERKVIHTAPEPPPSEVKEETPTPREIITGEPAPEQAPAKRPIGSPFSQTMTKHLYFGCARIAETKVPHLDGVTEELQKSDIICDLLDQLSHDINGYLGLDAMSPGAQLLLVTSSIVLQVRAQNIQDERYYEMEQTRGGSDVEVEVPEQYNNL